MIRLIVMINFLIAVLMINWYQIMAKFTRQILKYLPLYSQVKPNNH